MMSENQSSDAFKTVQLNIQNVFLLAELASEATAAFIEAFLFPIGE